jgi:hypothetical protein
VEEVGRGLAAQDRIAELDAEVQHYREKSERAENWLNKISNALLASQKRSEGIRRNDYRQDFELSTNERRRRNRREPPSDAS